MGVADAERSLAVVRRVCEGWAELERDEFHELFDAQVDYRNVPIEGATMSAPTPSVTC